MGEVLIFNFLAQMSANSNPDHHELSRPFQCSRQPLPSLGSFLFPLYFRNDEKSNGTREGKRRRKMSAGDQWVEKRGRMIEATAVQTNTALTEKGGLCYYSRFLGTNNAFFPPVTTPVYTLKCRFYRSGDSFHQYRMTYVCLSHIFLQHWRIRRQHFFAPASCPADLVPR